MKRPKFADLVVSETPDFVFINKPAHIASLEDRTTSLNILALARSVNPELQLCHRLDKETSGVLALAKHPEAYRHLAGAFAKRQVQKVYHAVVGKPTAYENTLVDRPIHKLSSGGLVKIDPQKGKESSTLFNTLTNFRRHSLVEALPETGRMHQIRIHLRVLGSPIVADEAYGGPELYLSQLKRHYHLKKGEEERPAMGRVALHAHALKFTGLAGEQVHAEAPYPKDFAVLLKHLERHDA